MSGSLALYRWNITLLSPLHLKQVSTKSQLGCINLNLLRSPLGFVVFKTLETSSQLMSLLNFLLLTSRSYNHRKSAKLPLNKFYQNGFSSATMISIPWTSLKCSISNYQLISPNNTFSGITSLSPNLQRPETSIRWSIL